MELRERNDWRAFRRAQRKRSLSIIVHRTLRITAAVGSTGQTFMDTTEPKALMELWQTRLNILQTTGWEPMFPTIKELPIRSLRTPLPKRFGQRASTRVIHKPISLAGTVCICITSSESCVGRPLTTRSVYLIGTTLILRKNRCRLNFKVKSLHFTILGVIRG